ncbi:hypothetical protein ACFQ5M_05160 [Agrilactobacillus yilanensis]|uniref:EF-hand domain-containing protein n=1 Tax=Agrilactobacillus yilanensis TaxID=2485997 RepID=A0ABW4J5M2_9LACO|nr:hypothetical protein [Agrilactobacillus yilanensis]
MKNLEKDFKNYILNHTNHSDRTEMAILLDRKFDQERNGVLTPSDLIDFITSFYCLLQPDFRQAVDEVMDADGHIRIENYYLFEHTAPAYQAA